VADAQPGPGGRTRGAPPRASSAPPGTRPHGTRPPATVAGTGAAAAGGLELRPLTARPPRPAAAGLRGGAAACRTAWAGRRSTADALPQRPDPARVRSAAAPRPPAGGHATARAARCRPTAPSHRPTSAVRRGASPRCGDCSPVDRAKAVGPTRSRRSRSRRAGSGRSTGGGRLGSRNSARSPRRTGAGSHAVRRAIRAWPPCRGRRPGRRGAGRSAARRGRAGAHAR
jgi:hypothetical protein